MFQFDTTVAVADLVSVVLLIVAIIGIFFTYHQVKEGRRTQKATFFKELYQTMFSDPDIRDAYYQIEYGRFTYHANFHGSKDEKPFDRLFSFVNLVCDLYAQRLLTEHEMSFFSYEFAIIYKNDDVQRYLTFLSGYYPTVVSGIKPFTSFVSYCKKALHK